MKQSFLTPYLVAQLIAETPCREGVLSGRVRAANPAHPESGRKRLREIKDRFREANPCKVAYYCRENRFYPTGDFKRYCRAEMRRYENG